MRDRRLFLLLGRAIGVLALGGMVIAAFLLRPFESPLLILQAPAGRTLVKEEVYRVYGQTTVTQTFVSPMSGLSGVAVAIPAHHLPPDTLLRLSLRDARNQNVMETVERTLRDAVTESGDTLVFPFQRLQGSRGREYAVTIAASLLSGNEPLYVRYQIDGSLYPDGRLYIRDRERAGDLGLTVFARPPLVVSFWRWAQDITTRGYIAGALFALLAFLLSHSRWRLPLPVLAFASSVRGSARFSLRRLAAVGLFIGLAVFVVFGPVLPLFFLQDDFNLLSRVRFFLEGKFPHLLLTNDGYAGGYAPDIASGRQMLFYRPLSQGVALAAMYSMFGTRPFPYHITHLVLHALAATMLFAFLSQLFHRQSLAFMTAVLWSVHPLTFGTVSWISESQSSLAALFFLSTLLAYCRFRITGQSWWLAIALVTSVLSFGMKENALVLPAALLLVDLFLERRWSWPDTRAAVARLTPFLLLLGLFTLLRTWMIFGPWAEGRIENTSYITSMNPKVVADNLIAYGLWIFGSLDRERLPSSLVAALLLGIITISVSYAARRRQWADVVRPAGFGAAFFLLTLLPVLPLALPNERTSRWIYMPLVGAMLLVAAVFAVFVPRVGRSRWTKALYGVGLAVAIGVATLDVWRGPVLTPSRTLAAYVESVVRRVQREIPVPPKGATIFLAGIEEFALGSISSSTFRLFYGDPYLRVVVVLHDPPTPLPPATFVVDFRKD